MVITTSTQWTIPLTSSTIAAPSPSLTKHGSVLGLKTCQLSAPPLALAGELHDLHSTSSRRLLGTPDVPHRRSAGSFRQLINEDFCAKPQDFACIDSPDWLSGKEYDAPHDGIAMPWFASSLHPNNFDCSTLGVHAFNSSSSNLDDLHGEITAEDVDLLPMPGMLSCPSPFCADSYISHAHSPKSSKMRSNEVSSPESSANSCKSSVMLPNYLGLPPNFKAEVDHTANVPVNPPPADTEHVRGGSNHLPFAAGTHVYGKDTDNFNELLAGLWTSSAVNCDADHMLDDSESLASIFNVFPQKFHGLSASVGRTDQSDNIACDNGSQLAVNDMHHLVNSIAEARDANAKVSESFHAFSASGYKVAENRGSMMWEATQQSVEHCIGLPHSNAGNAKSAHLLDTSVMLSESSLGGSMDSESSLEKKCEPVPILGMKRPFSMLQLAGIASSMPSKAGSAFTHAWHPSLGLPMPLKDEEVTHNFSTMLYKSQKDPKLAGFYYHMAQEQAKMEEEILQPQPSPAKVRRKHGTAMDPQSVAARSRREKFSERIRVLQSLVPNGERLDTVSMLGQTFEYVRYLQHQVWQLYHGKDPASPNNTCEKWKDFAEAERGSSANLA